MANELQIVNTQAIDELLQHIERDGDDVIIKPEAARAIATFKQYQKQLDDMEKVLKDVIGQAMENLNTKTLRGTTVTISKGAAPGRSRFTLQEGFKHEWGKQQVSYVPDVDKIEKYIEENGAAPEGVEVNEPKPTITIRLKKEQ